MTRSSFLPTALAVMMIAGCGTTSPSNRAVAAGERLAGSNAAVGPGASGAAGLNSPALGLSASGRPGSGGAAPAVGASATDNHAATGAALVTVTLSASCLSPGGVETATVHSRPGLQVSVNPRYPDGKLGNTYGGLAVARTIGPDGTYRDTWTVSPRAPVGVVTVFAGVSSTVGAPESGTTDATFELAARC